MNKRNYFFLVGLCLVSCKTIVVNKEFQKTTTHTIPLGTVGEEKDFVLEQDYNHIALPQYQSPIKVNVSVLEFGTNSYKAFTNAKTKQNKTVSVNYVDSVKNKPKYIKVDIADRVAVLNTLNNNTNKDVFNFLQNKKEAHMVTSIAMALNSNDFMPITNAEEVFLERTGIKNYALNLYNNKELQQTILFTNGVIFAYKTSSCCWKQNSKYQLEIIDLAEGNTKCPSQSYRNAKRANKKINYYKL